MDSNAIERQIRSVAAGKKNYLFVGSQDGGRRAAVLYSIFNLHKIHMVNPFGYLSNVLRRVHTVPASKIDSLTPKEWKDSQIQKNGVHRTLAIIRTVSTTTHTEKRIVFSEHFSEKAECPEKCANE